MRKTVPIPLVAIALTSCTGAYGASGPVTSTPEPIEKPVTNRCNAEPVQSYVGQPATPDVGAAIREASGARTLRWGPPDSAWTMDYREDRVNVRYDRDMVITTITCG